MVTLVGLESDLLQTLNNLVQLDLDAMEAYDLGVARVERSEYHEQLEAFKGDHVRHAEHCRRLSRKWAASLRPVPPFSRISSATSECWKRSKPTRTYQHRIRARDRGRQRQRIS